MNLVIIAAIVAVCSAAKLDRSYLPPSSAASAGGSSASLQTPLTRTTDQEPSVDFPSGSYTNNFQGVVVDADGPGTRASPDGNQSNLGGPRESYGSLNSKVGAAAFRESLAGFREPVGSDPTFKPVRPQAAKDRSSNIISYANEVSVDNYSYGFETDNGIAVGENGIASDGIKAEGGYSYQGDDGQVYKVTYTADEGGYRPQGNHLPTPPPIPKEILASLEQNAKDEAAGLVDDGSYDAQKYNAEGDYTHHNSGNRYNGGQSQNTKRPESDITASGSFINQNSQVFQKPSGFGNIAQSNALPNLNGLSTQFNAQFGSNFAGSKDNESQGSFSTGFPFTGQASGGLTAQFGQSQGSFGFNSQFGSQNNHQGSVGHSEGQTTQTSSQLGGQAIQPQSSQTGPNLSSSFGQSSINKAPSNQATQFGNQAFKPQASYGQTQNTQSSGIVQSQGLPGFAQNSKNPSSALFSSNKPTTSQSSNNLEAQVPNKFSSGYLPPFTVSNNPGNTNVQTPGITTQEESKDQSTQNSIPSGQVQGIYSASAAASAGTPGFVSQSGNPTNSFQSQSLPKPNQFNYNSVLNNLQSPTQTSASNTIGSNPTTISGLKPTAIPNIELTTPLEPNEKPAFEQGSFFNSQSISNVGNFGSRPQSNQGGAHFGTQNNIATSQQSTQSLVSSFPTSIPQRVPQISVTPTLPSSTPSTFSTEQGSISQTTFNQYQPQNSYYSTPKPFFSQGPDNSYYYKQPSKPFNTPQRPQGSRFPSMPSYQFNNGVTQNNQFSNQQGGLTGSADVVGSPSFATPTQTTQVQGLVSNNNYNGGITQAAASPFPSVSPTTSSQIGLASTSQFQGLNPSFSQTSSLQFSQNNKPTSPQQIGQPISSQPVTSFGQQSNSFTQTQTQLGQSSTNRPFTSGNVETQTDATLTQQYQGTIYEYNKPAVTLPPPAHTGSSSSQNVPTDSLSRPQVGQQSSAVLTKPQVESQQTQFNQNTFGPQTLQTSLNLGSRPQVSTEVFSKPFGNLKPLNNNFGTNTQATFSQTSSQIGSQNNVKPSRPTTSVTTSQFGQGSFQTYKPFGSLQSNSQFSQSTQASFGSQISKQPSKPFGSFDQIGQTAQSQYSPQSNLQNLQRPPFNAQPFKPFGNTGSGQSFETSSTQLQSKPQFTTQAQFTQQSFGSTQLNSQSGREPTVSRPTSSPSIHGSPEAVKPQFGHSTGYQEKNPTGSGQIQDTFSSSKPQIGSQFGQGFNTSPNQASSSYGQDLNFVGTTPASQYKPFGATQTGSISNSVSQHSQSSPCCQGSSGSSITPVKLSKPSQAFAQTQSQFSGGSQLSASSVAGKGEEFGGPREPPRFDATGYHY